MSQIQPQPSAIAELVDAIRLLEEGNMERGRWIRLAHYLFQVLADDIPGDIVELGCFQGHTALFLQRILHACASPRRLHVYDSFAGLPELAPQDAGTAPFLKPGFLACQSDDVRRNFILHGFRPPEIHPGWFHETLPQQLPDQIAFAHLDGDFYDSIRQSLEHVYPRLAAGALVVIDDYTWRGTPGAKRACDEFFADKPEAVSAVWCTTQGVFRKRAIAPAPLHGGPAFAGHRSQFQGNRS